MKTKQLVMLALLAVPTLFSALSAAKAQGTAFTYQGQLSASNSPAGGNYDFTFALFNTNNTNTGQQIGPTLTNLDVGVTNGLFIVTLDFGGVFTGTNYWLSITVRTNGAASFAALNPLQELTPTPYAIYAPIAGSATSASTATTASNVASGIAITNAVITNSYFEGNGGGLTNLNVITSQLTSYGNAIGQQNFFVGNAGNSTTTGSFDTALGDYALEFNTSGSDNTAFGDYALGLNTNGSFNTALGFYALYLNGSGSNNIALGYDAGLNINGGSSNIDIGNPGASTDANIIRIGSNQATAYIAGVITGNGGGLTNLSAAQLTSAGNTNGAGAYDNFFIGPAGNSTASGYQNTALGQSALGAITSGTENTAIGYAALTANTTGYDNTAIGFAALYDNTGGNGNTAVGLNALADNTSGSLNTAIGLGALADNTTGSDNTADGIDALGSMTNGAHNTAMGYGALEQLGILRSGGGGGTNNIALGFQAGYNYTANESGNIDIGKNGATSIRS